MASNKRILTLDIGSTGIKAAEFEFDDVNNMTMVQFGAVEYSQDLDETNRYQLISEAMQTMRQENKFSARRTLLSISGQFTLTRFVKLPPVSQQESKVRQIVEFEARQNVPFPIDEVVWDYQLIANPEADELEVMFVVVKQDIVDEITAAIQSVGLQPILVDVSSCAAYNAARANGVGGEHCNLVLDIGGRSSNLMFVENNQFFTRTIPIAGITITQQIAKELGVTFAEAEEIKLRHGFVGLGGAYEDPASEVSAAVSKIIRGVMTRLHGEINRSITLYRSHQKGEKPQRLYLAGGSSIMNYTDNFFSEKLGVEVEYLNPFKVVRMAPHLDLAHLEERAHSFSQLIGLGLRYRGACPVEVNLLPPAIKKQVAMNQKKPYLLGVAACVLMILVFSLIANIHRAQLIEPKVDKFAEHRRECEHRERQIRSAEQDIGALVKRYRELQGLLKRREQWVAVVNAVEDQVPDYLWVVQMRPIFATPQAALDQPGGRDFGGAPGRPPLGMGMPPMEGQRLRERREFNDFDLQQVREIEIEESGPQERIVGIEIRGNSLFLPNQTIPGKPAPEENAEAEESPANAVSPARRGGRRQGPEQVFLSRLQQVDFFQPDETEFEDYRVSDQILNLRTFTVRAMLADEIELGYME